MIIKRTDPDLTPRKRVVSCRHEWLFHVVEIDFHRSIFHAANNLDIVPAFGPRRPFCLLHGNHRPRRVIHDEDLARMLIGPRSEMRIVKVRWVLIAPEETQISMRSCIEACLLYVCGELKIADLYILQQCDAERT